MSTKRQSRIKLPPMETIITRRKSAQLKRQLRNQDVSRQKISQFTQLLRSPKSVVKSPKKRTVKKDDKNEYYPENSKRKVEPKKVVLKPKHELKVIAAGSKRKGVPQKGATNSPTNKRQKLTIPISSKTEPKRLSNKFQNQLSIEELVRRTDCEVMNDEDFLEILTCESPVWWEEPPDEGYCEDPIFTRNSSELNSENKSEKSNPKINDTKQQATTETAEQRLIPQGKEIDEKFMKKRSKLENLLGSIKTKLVIPKSDDKGIIKNNNNSTTPNKRKTDIRIKKSIELENKETNIDKNDNFESPSNVNVESPRKKSKKISESSEGDDPFSNLRDDEILRDLENMNIPVEPEIEPVKYDISPIKNRNNTEKNKLNIRNEYLNILRKKHVLSEESNDFRKEDEGKPLFSITSIERDNNFSSPTSKKSFSDETADSISILSHEIDSISDTNIKYIDEDSTSIKSTKDIDKHEESGIDKTEESNANNVTENIETILEEVPSRSKIIQESINKSDIDKTEECDANNVPENIETIIEEVPSGSKIIQESINNTNNQNYLTVYKIITTDDIDTSVIKKGNPNTDDSNEITDCLDGNLNSFYKKCKNTYQRRTYSKKPVVNNINQSRKDEKDSIKPVTNNINQLRDDQKDSMKPVANNINQLRDDQKDSMKPVANNINQLRDDQKDSMKPVANNINQLRDDQKDTKKPVAYNSIQLKGFKTKEFKSYIDSAKSIVVGESSNVKYCFKCSSIFDTEKCAYCLKKNQIANDSNCDDKPTRSSNRKKQENKSLDEKETESSAD